VATVTRKSVLRAALLALVYSAAVAWALGMFVTRPGMDAYGRARFGDSIRSRCERPFVTRVLVPWTVQAIGAVTPVAVRERVALAVRWVAARDGRLAYTTDCEVEFGLTILVLLGCLVGFMCVLRRLATRLTDVPRRFLNLVPIGSLLLLPVMYSYANYVYDPATLLLFTLALAMIAVRSRWFFLVYTLAAVNKETAVLLLIPWLLENRWELGPRSLASGLAVQLGVWLAIRGGIALLYRDSPGVMFEWWHWQRNVNVVARMVRGPLDGSFSKYAGRHWYKLIALAGIPVVVLSLKHSPPLLRRSLLMAVPIFTLSLVGGFFDELRVYYEVYAALVLAVACGLTAWLRPRPRPVRV
jgi:hypothetical protein